MSDEERWEGRAGEPGRRLTLHDGGGGEPAGGASREAGGPGQAAYEPGEPRGGERAGGGRGRGGGRHVERARVAALDDVALVRAMRADDPWAWSQFYARFRPILAELARRVRLPDGTATTEADALVDEVLADEASRLVAPGAAPVANLAGYLVCAARHKLSTVRRAAARRQRWYGEAARHDAAGLTVVVDGVCSEHALRASSGVVREGSDDDRARPHAASDAASGGGSGGERRAGAGESVSAGVLALAGAVRAGATDEEQLLLALVAEGTSHRMIAAWLGVSYDAATKRIWRLCRKLRTAALRRVAHLGPEERAEVERFLRRAGALPALVAAVSPAAARARYPRTPFDDPEGGGAIRDAPHSAPCDAPRDAPRDAGEGTRVRRCRRTAEPTGTPEPSDE